MKRHLLTIPGHAHTIECVLYETLEEMWESQDRDCHFLASYESRFNDDERPPIMGRIHLARESCIISIVAHELMHVVLDAGFALYSERDASGDLHVDNTEALCEMMESLTMQFWCWHYGLKHGVAE